MSLSSYRSIEFNYDAAVIERNNFGCVMKIIVIESPYLCASVSRSFTVEDYHKFKCYFPEFYGLEVHLLLNLRSPIICVVSGFRQFCKQLHERFVPPFCLFCKISLPG